NFKSRPAVAAENTLAEQAYRHAIALFDQEFIFWMALGQTLDAQAKYPEARQAYERAVALDPLLWLPRMALALHFEKIGDSVRADMNWLYAQRLVTFDVRKQFGLGPNDFFKRRAAPKAARP